MNHRHSINQMGILQQVHMDPCSHPGRTCLATSKMWSGDKTLWTHHTCRQPSPLPLSRKWNPACHWCNRLVCKNTSVKTAVMKMCAHHLLTGCCCNKLNRSLFMSVTQLEAKKTNWLSQMMSSNPPGKTLLNWLYYICPDTARLWNFACVLEKHITIWTT